MRISEVVHWDAQVGTFEEEQPLGKFEGKRNTLCGQGMEMAYDGILIGKISMHGNIYIYTHLIVTSYLHPVFTGMY